MASTETVSITKSEYEDLLRQKNLVAALQHELAQLKRMIFGSKSERHIPSDPNQPPCLSYPLLKHQSR